MTQYAIISPNFWNGETGKAIRQLGPEAQVVALYLISCPHRNALGLYYLPKVLISHETGIPFEGASKALRRVSEVGFCAYDPISEVVWVYEMARWQIGESLGAKDNRVKWINDKYEGLPKNPFLKDFYDKYGEVFHIKKCRNGKPLRSPLEAPSKPDSDSDSDSETHGEHPPPPKQKKPQVKNRKPNPPALEEVIAYFKSKGFGEALARKAFEYYEAGDWHDAHGKPVLSWKQKMLNIWMKEESREPDTAKVTKVDQAYWDKLDEKLS